MFNKALNYLSNNRPEKALALFKKLPRYKEVLLNMGNAYRLLDDDDRAVECYLEANKSTTPFTNNTFSNAYPIALNNLGLVAYTYENDDVAVEFYQEALRHDPTYSDPKWNMGNALLRQYSSNKFSNLKLCWDLYEHRFTRSGSPVKLKSKRKLPMWTGAPIPHVCIMVEQGFGDQIMFGRYLSLAAARCEKITVQCHDRAKELFSDYNTCSDPSETDATHGIGICSLGKIFSDTIPPGDWLNARLIKKPKNSILDIGVTWSGNPNHINDRHRSTTPATFRPFAELGNLYTLNPTEAGTAGFTTLDSGSWGDTIKALGKLDVVVCVDTSIAHLCGALGMPCIMINQRKNSDFRWGDSSMGLNNIWYPSVKVIRNNGWELAIQDAMHELKKMQYGVR
jgi:Tetratricopeptide repeat